MRRGLLNLATVVSLLVFLAGGVLWLRSLHVRDMVTIYTGERRAWWLTTRPGALQWTQVTNTVHDMYRQQWKTYQPTRTFPVDRLSQRTHFGFGIARWTGAVSPASDDPVPGTRRTYFIRIVVPNAAVMALAAILPGTWLWSIVRRVRRISAGHCAACGYDLCATPNRCPECGAVPREPPRTATAGSGGAQSSAADRAGG